MLVKRIDKGSIPVGLYETGEAIKKGRAVVIKGGKVMLPSSKAEASAVYGFATLRIDSVEGGDIADNDIVPAGTKVVVYTLVKNNMWGTTEIKGTVVAGDSLAVAYAGEDKGKLVKAGATAGDNDATALFTVFEVGTAGSYPMVDVTVN